MATDKKRTLQTTETSLEVLELLDELDGATVGEVAAELQSPPSTVHGHLSTLREQEFVVQKGDVYYLSLRFLKFGDNVRDRERLYTVSDRCTRQVVEETGYRSIFAVEEHGRGIYLSQNAGTHSKWSHEQTGGRFYLHASAAGKALLAHCPDDRIDEILDNWGLPPLTQHTITDRANLYREIETVREEGIAYNREEMIEGIRAVSAPIIDPNSREVGALSANGPAHRLADETIEEEIAETLRSITNEIKLDLKLAHEEVFEH